jgi:ssRNA-specific RNase YbeY (16S rRNA maturation enzyme)
MTTAVKKELKKLARETFREVLQEELMKQRGLNVLAVSDKEQKEINKLYKKPSGRVVRTTRVRI